MLDALFDQLSGVQQRKYAVIADIAVSGWCSPYMSFPACTSIQHCHPAIQNLFIFDLMRCISASEVLYLR